MPGFYLAGTVPKNCNRTGPLTVPVAAFRLRHGGPSVETPPRAVGADTDAVLLEAGFTGDEIAALRQAGDI